MAISGEQIARYYDEHKERFRLGAEKRMKAITAALTGRKRSDSAARSALRKVSRRLAAGASFESVYDSLWRKPGGPLSATEITFGPHAQPRTFDLGNPQLAGEIARTSPGQVTGIIEENGSAGIYYCVEVRDLVYMSIEQADPGIRRDIIDRRYAELVDQWVGQARVKVVKRNMARAAMKQGG